MDSSDLPIIAFDSLPESVLSLVRSYHAGGITQSDCIACSSSCCAHGGFAILENVVAIYDRYQRGDLKRNDYDFPAGMTFREFVLEYFDVYRHDVPDTNPVQSIVFFHMRSLSPGGHAISIPAVPTVPEYMRARNAFFSSNPRLNTGCVFLSHGLANWPEEDGVSERKCILHSADSGRVLGEKPIDCVFHTCDTPRSARTPTSEQSHQWFTTLAQEWPNSVERFRQLIDES